MKIILSFSLLLLSFAADAGGANIALRCQEKTTEDGEYLILTANEIEFRIKSHQKTCESEFEYTNPDFGSDKIIITAWPTSDKFGVNAQRDLFISSSSMKEAKYIGSVPVEAALVSEGRYRNISQIGGSMHETIYFLEGDQVKIEKPSKELIFSDTQCIYLMKNNKNCQELTGTFEEPICVYSDGDRKILERSSSCSELLQRE